MRVIVSLACCSVFAGAAGAQVLEPKPPGLELSARAEASLAALDAVGVLPTPTWRVHPGDLAHGEAVALDDRAWPLAAKGYVSTKEAVWFRRVITVPKALHGYALAGAALSFQFEIWTPGPVPIIVYFDGRRVAMGEALEPIALVAHARPSQKIVIAVKALSTPDVKHFDGSTIRVGVATSRPDPGDLRQEALAAQYLLPVLANDPAPGRAALEAALADVDLAALRAGRQAAFDRSLRAAHARLASLKPTLAGAQFHLTGDAHIDAAWTWPWTETVDVVRRTFSTALQLMREYPRYTFSQSVAGYFDWMAEKYPAMDDEIRARVREGRWEMVGGMWAEPDLNMPDGESLVRQLLLGKALFRDRYGVDVRVGWNPDSFGFNWQLPQIYKKAGIDYFVTQKMGWNETNLLPLKLFYWQSPDGSRVLTYFPHNYTNYVEPERLAKDFALAREANPGTTELMHLYGIGDHGGGPTRAMLDTAERWMDGDKVFPPERYGDALSYFTTVEPRIDRAAAPVWSYATLAKGAPAPPSAAPSQLGAPVWNDELYLEYTRGVFTSQATQKRNMRRSEEALLDAEKWTAFDWLEGGGYAGATLDAAWKKALFNQNHDIAGGSAVGVVYKDAQRDYDMVFLTTAAAQATAQARLAEAIDTRAPPGAVPILVWNPLGWARSDVATARVRLPADAAAIEVVDAAGRVAPSQSDGEGGLAFLARDVPSLGYRVFYARPAIRPPSASEVSATTTPEAVTLQNAALSVTVDRRTGCITRLVEHASGFDSLAPGACGGQLQTFHDQPAAYDAWNIDAAALDKMTPIQDVDSVELGQRGPLRAAVHIERRWGRSRFSQDVSLTSGLDHLDIANVVDWRERHVLLKAAFPLAVGAPTATYEIPFGSIARPTTRDNPIDAAKFEVPAIRWADLGGGAQGFSLINESKYGYDAKDKVLRLSLLRAPTDPDPQADQGEQRFAYSLYPHAGDWRAAQTVRHGYAFNQPLSAQQVAPHPGRLKAAGSFVRLEPDNLVLTAAKRAQAGDGLVLRFYESAGLAGEAMIRLPPSVVSAVETDLLERPHGPALATTHDSVRVAFTPFGITTAKIVFAKVGSPLNTHRPILLHEVGEGDPEGVEGASAPPQLKSEAAVP